MTYDPELAKADFNGCIIKIQHLIRQARENNDVEALKYFYERLAKVSEPTRRMVKSIIH